MRKGLAIAGLGFLCLAAALAISSGAFRGGGRPQAGGPGVEKVDVAKVLEDRSQPWWNNHRPPKVKGATQYMMAPSDDLGARKDPPIYTAQMPVEVASWLLSGGKPAEGNPLRDRPFILLDVRRRSQFQAEFIQGALNVPASELESSLENGELSKLDRRAVVVAFGSRFPHFEVVSRLRSPKGFDAVYAMGGLEAWEAKGLPVVRDEKLAAFLKVLEAERAASAPAVPAPVPGSTDPIKEDAFPGLDPLALKAFLDGGVDLMCLFVGDRKTYEAGHVPGAIHVPAIDIEKKLATADRDRLVAVTCGCCQGRRGGPSEIAYHQLVKMGFKRVIHLDGHMYAWKAAGLPVEYEDPPPGK